MSVESWIAGRNSRLTPAEGVVDEEELPRVEAIGQVARRDRAHEVEHAHQRERAGGGGRREPVVDRVGDEVLPDHPVRRRAADEERPGEEPELGRADGPSHDPRVRSRRDGRGALGQAERPEAHGGRILAEQEQRRDRGRGDEHRQDDDRRPPRISPRERRQDREEDELARARRRAEDADDEAPMREEPAVRDDRAERAGEQTRPRSRRRCRTGARGARPRSPARTGPSRRRSAGARRRSAAGPRNGRSARPTPGRQGRAAGGPARRRS